MMVMDKISASMASFRDELLKLNTIAYPPPRQGVTTSSGVELKAASEGASESSRSRGPRSPHYKTAAAASSEFKVTREEAEQAARRLREGPRAGRLLSNVAAFAALRPAASIVGKGAAAAALSKGRRGQAALEALKSGIKDKKTILEQSVAGGIGGAALTGLSEGADIRKARGTIKEYLREGRGFGKRKLKKVL